MKILWLCNMMPGKVAEAVSGNKSSGGLWVDRVLEGLRRQENLKLHILCPGEETQGVVDASCSYRTFALGLPYRYRPQLEEMFRLELEKFRPDAVHIWGTEYAHTLAMVNACEKENLLDHTLISIQGLCSVCAGHYEEGLPARVCRGFTLRDFLRQDNIRQQRNKFALRGQLEVEALRKVRHVIGRTDWDRACTKEINPGAQYHFCNETMREDFYDGQWRYEECRKHRIFASSCAYPVKGFHYLLEAFPEVVKRYPDATIAVTGKDPRKLPLYRLGSYQKYLISLMRKNGLEGKIEFLGGLSAEKMKAAYLEANAFVLPSTIENSPNSLAEAMLLGVPCVAADVGGVSNMLANREEGFVYQPTAPYMLAYYIDKVFAMEDRAEAMGQQARAHAEKTHSFGVNLDALLEIYRTVGKETL